MSDVLSREQVALYDRWLPPFVGAVEAAQPASDDTPPGPTVAELEEIQRQAREEGYAAGLAEGRAAAKLQLDERLARLEAILVAAARPLAGLDDAVERELALLATTIARRVVGRELRLDPALVVAAVREAAAALPAATRELRVHCHPDDLALLGELGASEPHWRFLGDPLLQRGDCLLDTPRSRLDARVQTRLNAVIDAVLGEDRDADANPDVAADTDAGANANVDATAVTP